MLVERKRLTFDLPLREWLEIATHPRAVRVVSIDPAVAAEVAALPTSGAVSVMPVPSGPAVPTEATTACSMHCPVRMVSVSPALTLASAASLMFVAPGVVEAASVVWVAALPTAVTVAISTLPPRSMLILSPTAKPSTLCTGRLGPLPSVVLTLTGVHVSTRWSARVQRQGWAPFVSVSLVMSRAMPTMRSSSGR